jgi:hypothetical protein
MDHFPWLEPEGIDLHRDVMSCHVKFYGAPGELDQLKVLKLPPDVTGCGHMRARGTPTTSNERKRFGEFGETSGDCADKQKNPFNIRRFRELTKENTRKCRIVVLRQTLIG